MQNINKSEQIAIAASQLVTERDYWLNKLSGEWELSRFPYDNHQPVLDERESPEVFASRITGDLFEMLMKLNGGSLQRLHMILVTAVMILLKKYSRNSDIIIVSPIYRQEVEGEFLNTVLLMRNRVSDHVTFKELLLQVRKTIVEAAENQNYPLERLLEQLGTAEGAVWERAAALFDTAVLLENIHDRRYLREVRPGIIFSFSRCKDSIEVSMEYDSRRYEKTTARRIVRHLETLLKECCTHIHLAVEQINILSVEEKEQILYNFNNTEAECPGDDKQEKLLHRCFEQQVERSPHHTAVTFGNHHLTYVGLNLESNQLAKLLRRKGIKPDCIVGVMMERSLEMIAALLGVLKAGGAYLPLDPDYPSERIDYMLKDSQVSILIIQPAISRRHSFTALQGMGRRAIKVKPRVTAHRVQIKDLDALSFPDRSWVDYEKYHHLLEFVKVDKEELAVKEPVNEEEYRLPGFYEKLRQGITVKEPAANALRILMLDLSQFFSRESQQFYDLVEPPLGLMYLMTFLNEKFGSRIHGKIAKSRIDFDSYQELKVLLEEFKPKVIGIRTLSVFSDFFHEVTALVRQWCDEGVIIAGGPHATCSYDIILQDRNVDLVVLGEGEITFAEIIQNIMETGGKLPGDEVLREINGIAFIPRPGLEKKTNRDIFVMDIPGWGDEHKNPEHIGQSGDLAYVIFTSGSTGSPKPVGVEHKGVVNMLLDRRNQYQMNSTFTTLQLFPYIFDGFVTSFFTPIISGAKVIIPKDDEITDISMIKEIITRHKVTHFISIPGFYKLIIENLNKSESAVLKIVTLAGDKISPDILKITKEKNANIEIVNEYGVTECSVLSTIYRHQEKNSTIMIGKPTTNTRIYIVGQDRILPLGVPGEMCIAGSGVARGYLNNPKLTAKKFINYKLQNTNYNVQNYKTNGIHALMQSCNHASRQYHSPSPHHPITPIPHSPVYRTGDLARWLNDGNIEFLGRVDQQVKIRGFRIELGEIESRLLAYDDLTEAVVISIEKKEGEKYLCAYYVAVGASSDSIGAGPPTAVLIEYLSRHLPYYMIPSYFIPLEKIPVTPNGKIDRRALPEPEIKGGENYMAPINATEEKLAEIWSEILSLEKSVIGIEDNFFRLGGHSLTATIMADKAHKAFNIRLPLAEIFTSPTISGIAGYIKRAEQKTFVSIAAVEKKEYYPLSSQQKRLYIIQQMELQSTAYNMPQFISLDKNIHIENLEVAFKKLIDRHESLRTYFVMTREAPFQKILDYDHVGFQIEYYDIPEVEAEVKASHPLSELIRPFDLGNAPLLRMGLIKTLEGKQVLFIDMHHIINDGTSQLMLNREFTALFKGNELPLLKLQYKDYAQWQNSENQKESLKQHEIYWLDTFKGELPVLKLPIEHPRPLIQQFEGYSLRFTLNEKESRNLKDLGNNRDNTLFMTLLSVYTILLSKLSGQEDIIVGTPIAGRRHVDLEHIIGMFVNTLALRNYPSAEKSVTEFLSEVREQTLNAFENQEYQFEELVEKVSVQRDASRNPIFDVMFQMLNLEEYQGNKAKSGESQEQSPYMHVKEVSKFDMSLTSVDLGARLFFSIQFSTNLFEPGTIERFIGYFKKIAAEVANNPGIPISQIEIISQAEKNQILIDFNDTGAEYPNHQAIHQLFEAQVERVPENIAIIGPDPGKQHVHLTYNQLNKTSNQLAYVLKEKGIKPDTIVGIMIERSIDMIIGIMGILKAGGAYLPIDHQYPDDRIKYMLEDSSAKMLMITPVLFEKFEKLLMVSCQLLMISEKLPGSRRFNTPPQEANSINNYQFTINNSQLNSSNLAYIIYTSGSTGDPKGVLIQHGNVVRLVKNSNYIHFNQDDKLLLTGNIVFDVTTFEIWGPLLNGVTLYLADEDVILNAEKLEKTLLDNEITLLHLIPQLFNQLAAENMGIFRRLRVLLLGGDVVRPEHVNKVRHQYKNLEILHMYGPTENTTFSTFFPVKRGFGKTIPIGRPVSNSSVIIIDKYGKLQPGCLPGELCTGGDGVARGYLNRPELTAEKFDYDLQDCQDEKSKSFCGEARGRFLQKEPPGHRRQKIYRTGDLARWLTDGNIEFLGRIDHQVKIRGFRVELGEIENCLLSCDRVKEVAVVVKETQTGDKHLCAYLVPDNLEKEALGVEENELSAVLKEYLLSRLPGYMIPQYFVPLEMLPLKVNGKLDRKSLPEPGISAAEEYTAPRDELEEKLADIWSGVLGVNKEIIGIDDNFFNLGGHSLSVIILAGRIKKELKAAIPLGELFRTPTLRGISSLIEVTRWVKEQGIGTNLQQQGKEILL
jgi:tyrocidine synthetase-3